MSRKSFYKQSSKVESDSTTTTYEVEKPAHFKKSGDSKPKQVTKKSHWLWWFVATSIVFVLVSAVCVFGVSWWYWQRFENSSGTRLLPLVQDIWKNHSVDIFESRDYKTFLLLGVDQSSHLRDTSMLTDTMMLALLRSDGQVTMVSLPRDLWIDSLKTKVNALYYYGQQTNPGDGVTLVSSVMAEITGMPIDYYFVINMDTMRAMVDALGGIDVTVVRSFEDKEYPREIDLSSSDPAVLYESIRFDAGVQHMDGATALKFIRSRHSKDEFEGTDGGREERQQLLLSTLKKEATQPKVITNPDNMGALYRVWKQSIRTNMSDLDAFLLAKRIATLSLTLRSTLIPIQNGSESGLIYHPVKGPSNQWVYTPVDPTWNQLHRWFSDQLSKQ